MAPRTADSVDQLYAEALRLADAARSYFDGPGRSARAALSPAARSAMATESLRITTRLITVVSWGLLRQAVRAGDIKAAAARVPERRLHPDDSPLADGLPRPAYGLAVASRDLFARVCATDSGFASMTEA